jgi:hypothetical protein
MGQLVPLHHGGTNARMQVWTNVDDDKAGGCVQAEFA